MLITSPSLLAAQLPDRRDLRRHDGELRRRLGKVDFVPGVSVRFPGLLERRIAFMFRASKYRRFQSFFDNEERFLATEKWIEREIARNAPPAAKRGARALSNEPHARAAHYDEKAGRIVVDLTNGAQFAFPPKIAQGLARAKKADLKEIVVSPKGTGLHWPKLDADLTVAGLLAGIFGSRMWMRELASTGGKAVSERKAAAARVNGAKGGRLRLVQAA